jgi:glycosyltransferase involved in cell wall biosynthesis
MKILSLTAGAADMYCGSCLRDNAVATELLARGHDVTLLPLYTPTTTDEPNVSRPEVLFGGVSVYMQHHWSLFRRLPRFLDRLWDAPRLIKAVAGRGVAVDPRLLGGLTVSMLQGERGVLRREFGKLLEWLATEPPPDVIEIPNSLLIALAGPLRTALKRPISCTLQGEDLFLDGLVEPYRQQAVELIREHVADVDQFVAVSEFYAPVMARRLSIPRDRIAVVPIGINLAGYERHPRPQDGVFRVGYFARLAPEKGLHGLVDAYRELRRRTPGLPMRLEVAGYLAREHTPYLDEARRRLAAAGIGDEFTYHGVLDRGGKIAFLQRLDVLSVPATYDEPKGMFLLEAMACGLPVVQPRRGAFTEVVEKTGGGVLVPPDNAVALADGLYELWKDPSARERLGMRGMAGVREHYGIATSVDRLLDVYGGLVASPARPPRIRAAVAR